MKIFIIGAITVILIILASIIARASGIETAKLVFIRYATLMLIISAISFAVYLVLKFIK